MRHSSIRKVELDSVLGRVHDGGQTPFINSELIFDEAVDWRFKGFQPAAAISVGEITDAGLNVLSDGWTFPVMVLRANELMHNLEFMSNFCASRGVQLAPHAKTHMSPQLAKLQEMSGIWGLTVANVGQAELFIHFGFTRFILANSLADPRDIRWVAEARQKGIEITVILDSTNAVRIFNDALSGIESDAVVDALVELGFTGGRTGCRTLEEARAVVSAISESPRLRFVGVEGYEGVIPGDDLPLIRDTARKYLLDARETVRAILEEHHELPDPFLITFGGSSHFDIVADVFSELADEVPLNVSVILRSGCYLAHDDLFYKQRSPFIGHSEDLKSAIEIVTTVISAPEPNLAFAALGKRDTSLDCGLPVVKAVVRDGKRIPIDDVEVTGMNDHHSYLRLAREGSLAVGDILVVGISHPCTTFDRWPLAPVVDNEFNVLGAVRTYF